MRMTPIIPPKNITINWPKSIPPKWMPILGNVTAIARAANIESIANAISANSTLKTVPQKL